MYAARASGKGKKDLQAFMRDKLAKTKIASESVATAQLSSVNNFKKAAAPKKATNVDRDDTESVSNVS